MADNVTVENGDVLSDYTVATDDDGTAQHQYVKLEYGADGTFTKVGSGANAVPIQDGGNSITVDGTVAATLSEPISVDDNGGSLTVDGSVSVSGTASVTVKDSVGDSAMDDANNALRVNVVAGAAGGTQYTEADTDASITGTAVMWEDAADTLRAVSAAKPLPVDTEFPTGVVASQLDAGSLSTELLAVEPSVSFPVSDGTNRIEILASGADNVANTTNELITAGMGYVFDGAAWDRAPGNATDGTLVNLGTNNDVTVTGTVSVTEPVSVDDNGGTLSIDDGAGSITVDGTVTANQGTAGTAWEVIGDVAHDAAAPANPVVVGGQMETMADTAPATRAGTDADAVKLASTDGALYVVPTGPQTWSYHENSSSALTDTSVHAAPGAGLSLYVTTIVFSTGAATACNIFFEEGASTVLGPWYLEAVAGRGLAITFQTPKKITANTALTVTTSAAIAHSIDVTGFVAPG